MARLLSRKGAHVLLVVLAVALVALAGCNTGGGGTTGTPSMSEAPHTNGTQTPTPTPATTETPSQTPSPPPAGSVNGSAIAADHVSKIQSAGTFTTNVNMTFVTVQNGSRSSIALDQTAYLNLDDQVGLQSLSTKLQSPGYSSSATSHTYTAGNETFYRQNVSGSSVAYRYGTAPYNASEPSPVNFSSASGETLFSGQGIYWLEQGQTTFQGETLTKYTADGLNSMPNISESLGTSFKQVDSANATLLVADSGVVRRMTLSVSGVTNDGANATATVSFTVTDVGSTTVPTPDWLDQARQSG